MEWDVLTLNTVFIDLWIFGFPARHTVVKRVFPFRWVILIWIMSEPINLGGSLSVESQLVVIRMRPIFAINVSLPELTRRECSHISCSSRNLAGCRGVDDNGKLGSDR